MKPITLEEMKDVKLMNRVDTKYLVTSDQLLAILKGIGSHYYAQVVEGNRLSPYSTIYYDTPDLMMYTIHHDRHLVRDKVRVRTYIDSKLTFCEVKHKTNKGRTKKKRIEVPYGTDVITDPEASAFLAERQPYRVDSLRPSLETAFSRFTLVNHDMTERLTIDCNLVFNNCVTGTSANMGDLVIMELKQDGRARSLLKEVLFDLRIKPYNISKYCIGTAMSRPDVKQNRFKKKIRKINKLLTDN